ncbi:hypothetical protein Pta02_73300 [Planobispora takensis]|uniref:Uncharacterized protein n=1 Tax=Planobispora takensis TaxID=1367882 RepID=A0A8J3T4U3_9ACTN|nr:hypothetical protein Pta02_73300 [Planobispora takensis]
MAYLRMPYRPDPGDDGDADERLLFAGLREVRHTIIRIITSHLRDDAAVSWQGYDFDFTGVVFDGADFTHTVFSGSTVSFGDARRWSHPPLLPDPLPAGVLPPRREPYRVETGPVDTVKPEEPAGAETE